MGWAELRWNTREPGSRSKTSGLVGVEEEFLVAFGSGEVAWLDVLGEEAEGFGGRLDGGDGSLVQGRVGDDAARADIFAAEFKLGFDEDEEVGAGGGAADCGGENFSDGDERDVGDNERCGFGYVGGPEVPGVALDWENARVLLELPVELAGVDVDGENFGGAMLEEAVGEAAVGGAEIKADFVAWVDGEVQEGAFEFEATAGDVLLEAAADFNLCVVGDGVAGLGDRGAVHKNFGGQDHGLGFLAGRGEAADDEELVQAELGHMRRRPYKSVKVQGYKFCGRLWRMVPADVCDENG